MFRAGIVLIVGLTLVGHGYLQQLWRAENPIEPTEVALKSLEQYDLPPDAHVRFGKHVRLFDYAVISFEDPKRGMRGTQPPPDAKVLHCYIPVLSAEYAEAIKQAKKKSRLTGRPVTMDQLAVVIKSREYRRFGEIPVRRRTDKSLQGMLVTNVENLPAEEREEIRKIFRSKFLDRVWVLEEGTAPPKNFYPQMILALGACLCVYGLVLAWRQVSVIRERRGISSS